MLPQSQSTPAPRAKITSKITEKGYVVYKQDAPGSLLDEIRQELTVRPNVNPNYAVQVDPYPVYRENSTKMYLPRFYGCSKLGPPTRGSIYDTPVVEQKARLETTITLRDYQKPIVDETLRILRGSGTGSGGGVLELYTGSGKTSIAVYIMCSLKVKTLIVVHKSFLLQQWVDRIRAQTTPALTRIGVIQGTTFDVTDKDVVIGMLQTLSMKDFSRDQEKELRQFGMVIVDETHHIGAEVFCRALPKIASRYMLGLSATPVRKDGLTKVIYWYMGDTAYRLQRDGDESQRVFVKKVVFKPIKKDSVKNSYGREHRNFKGVLMLPQMISDIVAYEPRNDVIVNEIMQYSRASEPGRQVMVISDRIQHLHHLKHLVDTLINRQVDQVAMTTAFYTGQQKQKELQIAEKADIIFSSYAMCREGLDIQTLNTLILATSTGDVVQTCGRILRKVHDVSPFIVDIVDTFSTFAGQSKKRDAFYKKSQYAVYKINSDSTNNAHMSSVDVARLYSTANLKKEPKDSSDDDDDHDHDDKKYTFVKEDDI